MRSRYILAGFLLLLLASALAVGFFRRPAIASDEPSPERTPPTAASARLTPAPVQSTPPAASLAAAPSVEVTESGEKRTYAVALDEIATRLPSGKSVVKKIARQPNLSALKGLVRAMPKGSADEVRPVVYEMTADGLSSEPRFVSREIRVETSSAAGLSTAIPEVVSVETPDYAPGFAVVTMSDSFAALEHIEAVRRLPRVQQADVLLAKQQSKRALPNDTLIGQQWHLKNTVKANTDINVEAVWNYPGTGYRGTGINVGVVDDGLQTAHPDLAANVRTDIDYDWNDDSPDDPNPGSGDDHGTACAGNVGAVGNNALGVAGSAPEAKLVGMRLIAASTTDAQEAEAMHYLKDQIEIKSNSWGPSDTGTVLEAPGSLTKAALKSAAETGRGGKGSIFLWAGGNGLEYGDNSNYDGYANSIYTIAIGALTNQQLQAYYSESGANLVVVAPSNGGTLAITTTDRTGSNGYNSGDYTSTFGGTSSATPTAAGVVALMLQRNPNLGWRDVQEILIKTAVKVAPTDSDWVTTPAGFRFNHKFGAGLIDANAAVNSAATWTNLGAQTSTVSTQSSLNIPIPNNNPTGITRTFAISTALRVEQVTVRVTINHTARGNLAITLTSPGGVSSRLSELHSDTGNHYTNWTFSTVRDWGESSTGTWSLKVADLSNTGNTTGGTLTAAELVVFGVSSAPTNPAPVVQLTSPTDQASYSIGASIPLSANASDLTSTGAAGVVSMVEFLANNAVVATKTAAPYTASWVPPAAGSYTLQARATDSEGAVGLSGTVSVSVTNQPPVISSASVTPAPQAFADQALGLTGVNASDPEGSPVTISYQWQNSTDGITFANAAGQTGASVAASSGNAAKVWRCVLTPNDGSISGTPYTTGTTMVLTRPATQVQRGTAYSYVSDLVLRGNGDAFTRTTIINEFSQGPSGGIAEWVEILTLQPTSLVGWKFLDASGTTLTFSNNALWTNVAAGTLIVIYNGSSKDPNLPADDLDASDGNLVVSSSAGALFTGGWPSLGNGGDALVLKNSSSVTIHQISYGTETGYPPNIGSVGSAKGAAFTGDTESAATVSTGWRVHNSTDIGSATVAGVTPGMGNTTANLQFVSNLRTGYYNQPALFRLGSGAQLPQGLSLSSTGVLNGTVIGVSGNYPIVIEAFNGLGEMASMSYTLNVQPGPITYAQWTSTFPGLTDTSPGGDPEGDGRRTLLEYFQGFDPTLSDGAGAIEAAVEGSDVVLRYRKSKEITGVTESVSWTTTLSGWFTTGITFDADQDMGTYVIRTARKPMGIDTRIFLRLTVQ